MTRLHPRLDRPRGLRLAVPFGALGVIGGLTGAGCALVGYGFDGYGGVGGATGGGGGSSQQSSGGAGGVGGAGRGGSSAGGGGSTSSSSTTGTGAVCKGPSECDDKSECTLDDCVMGFCASTLVTLDDGDPCTSDFCEPDKGVYHLPKTCDDGNLCTQDSCNGKDGSCSFTIIPGADDGNSCTNDLCDPGSGSTVYVPVPSCCPHSVCTPGVALDPGSCPFSDPAKDCIKIICSTLPSCCSTSWSATCAALVPGLCGGGMTFLCNCTHSYCKVGAALSPSCDPCVHSVCSVDDTKYCCDAANGLGWNASCVNQAHNLCQIPLGAGCQ